MCGYSAILSYCLYEDTGKSLGSFSMRQVMNSPRKEDGILFESLVSFRVLLLDRKVSVGLI